MSWDILEALEKVFTGLLNSIYNVLESICILALHPRHGARFLWMRYCSQKCRQIGPNTLLFLSFLPSTFIMTTLSVQFERRGVSTALVESIKLREWSDFFLIPSFSALMLTILMDFPSRFGKRPRYTNEPRGIWKYKWAFVVMMSSLFFALFILNVAYMPNQINGAMKDQSSTVIGFTIFFYLLISLTAISLIGYLLPSRFFLLKLAAIGNPILGGLIFSASWMTVDVTDKISQPNYDAYLEEKASHIVRLAVTQFECRKVEGKVILDIVLRNPTSSSVIVETYGSATIQNDSSEPPKRTNIKVYATNPSIAGQRFQLIEPLKTVVMTFAGIDISTDQPWSNSISCSMKQEAAGVVWLAGPAP